MPQLGGAALEIRLRFLGDGEAGTLDPALRGIDEPRAPSWTDLEDAVSRLQAELLETIVELPDGRGAQRVLRSAVDALRVHRMVAIEEAQEEPRIDVVVIRYRLPIGPDLAEQQRLQETPQGDGIMPITHRPADLEGSQHVAFDIDMARDIGVADPPFVHAGEGAQGLAVAQGEGEARRAVTEASATTVRKDDLEGSLRLGEATQDSIDKPRRLFGRCCRNAWRVGSSRGRSLIIHVRSLGMATAGLYNVEPLVCHRLLRDCSPWQVAFHNRFVVVRQFVIPGPLASAFARIALTPAR